MEPPDWVHDEVVSLSEFARLIPSHSRRSQTPENKAAALRMARRRDLAFPEPRVTRGRGEVFRLGDLVEWASARGLPVVFEPTWLIVHALRHTASALGSEAACLILAAELLRRPVDSEDERRPWEQGTRPPHDRPGVADRSPADRLAATVEFAIEGGARPSELLEAALEDVGPHASPKPASTPRGLAELLVAVGDPHPGELVEDPAIGQGEIAMAAARHAGGAVTITGGDVDPNAAFIAAARLQLAGVPFEADTGAQDALASESEHEGRADVVLLDPPFGPDMLPWVQVALRRAKTGGRAVVVLPMSALEPDSGILASVEPGSLEAVIFTPDRMRTDTGQNMALWVLRKGRVEPEVLLVDARFAGKWHGTRKAVDPAALRELAKTVHAWQRGGRTHSGGLPVRRLNWKKVLSSGYDLRPDTWFRSPDRRTEVERALSLVTELDELINGPLAELSTEEHRRALTRLRTVLLKGRGRYGEAGG